MKNLDRDSIDLGNGKIKVIFLKMLFPTLLGMIFSAVFVLTDGIFVGHGIGSNALAAINIVMPVFNIATGIGMMIAIGSSVIVAIHLSEGNLKAARINTTQAFEAVIFSGVLLGLILYMFPSTFLDLFGAEGILLPMCREYYKWFVPCGLFVMIQIVGQFLIRLDGNPKFASLVEIVPACLNIFLDWLFIFPLDKGLAGAAFATSAGTFSGVLMAAWYMMFKRKQLKLYKLKCTLTSLVLTLRNIWYMIKTGFSGLIGELSISILTLVGNKAFFRLLGEDGVAAYSVTCYLIPVVFMVYSAIAQSAQPIISFNHGSGNSARVRKAFIISIACSTIFGVIMTLFFTFGTDHVIALFLEEGTGAYCLCTKGFPLYSMGIIFMGICMAATGYCQSIEKSAASTFLTLSRGLVLPVTAFLVLPEIAGTAGLWLAVPAAEALTFLFVVILCKKEEWI